MYRAIIICLFFCCTWNDVAGQCEGFSGIVQVEDNSAVGHSFSRTNDGGFLLAGVSSNFGSGNLDWIVTKLDAGMQPVFSKAIGWSTEESGGNTIVEEFSDQTIVHAGYRLLGNRITTISKLSADGNLLWSNQLVASGCTPRDIEETSDGGILVSGSVQVSSSVSDDIFMMKLSADGDFIWGRRFDSSDGNEHIYGITVDDSGVIYCVGNTEGFAGNHRGFVMKMDQAGVVLDQMVFNSGNFSTFLDVKITGNNELLISGYENVGSSRNGVVIKSDLNLNIIWQRLISFSNITTAVSVEVDVLGRIVTGFSNTGGGSFLSIAHLNGENGDVVNAVRTENGDAVVAQVISNVFQSGPVGDVAVLSSTNISLYAFDSCFGSDCQGTAAPDVTTGTFVVQDYSIPTFDLPEVDDATPTVLNIDLAVNSECVTEFSFEAAVNDGCAGDDFIFELIDVSDINQVASVVWSVSGLDDFDGNPSTLVIENPGNYTWSVLVTTVSGSEYSETGILNVFGGPGGETIPLPEDVNLCGGEAYQIDFAPFLNSWDAILDSDGNEITNFESGISGVYSFTFVSQCTTVQHQLELLISPEYDLDAPSFACVNDAVEVSLSPVIDTDSNTELTINWGDSNSQIAYDGHQISHVYENIGTFPVQIQGVIDGCDIDVLTSIQVQNQPIFNLADSVSLCFDESFELDFTVFDFEVFNSAGVQIDLFETNISGSYPFTATNFCGTDEETVSVFFDQIEPMKLQFAPTICEGLETIVVGFEPSPYTFLWNDGSTNPAIEVTEQGTYSVLVSSAEECTRSYAFTLSAQLPLDLSVFPDNAVELCSEGKRTIILPYLGVEYIFPNGGAGLEYEVSESEILFLQFNDGCYDYDVDIEIEVYDCLCPLFVPNAFTPDEDGLNDIFKPVADCPVEDYHLRIFNRLGTLIFESRNINFGWNGRSPNENYYAENELYLYHIVYAQRLDGLLNPKELSGHLTLLR